MTLKRYQMRIVWDDDVRLSFEWMSMHMYNRVNVCMVNKQVNGNILYRMDNEVRDPSIQLYLF